MIEQERRDRELALRLAQDPDAVDTEVQQAPQLPLQRYADSFYLYQKPFRGFRYVPVQYSCPLRTLTVIL